jgi:aspartyl-tRNA(Asn)/glutamyl-tRNA(Gln) amidotransferase subunit A
MGRFVTAPDYLKAEQLRTVLIEDFRRAFERVDVIVGPTTPITAWKSGEWTVEVGDRDENVLAASWRFTFPYNLTGLPAISVPCGFDANGLPIGLQIAARPFDEMAVLSVAHAYERTHEWCERMPELA